MNIIALFLYALSLKVSWDPSASGESFLIYIQDREELTIIQTTNNEIIIPLFSDFPDVKISSLLNGNESELIPLMIPVDGECYDRLNRVLKTCGKKCSKVK